MSDEKRSNERTNGMRGGMSQFRAQTSTPRPRLRVKQYDPSRRSYVAGNDDEVEVNGTSGTQGLNGHIEQNSEVFASTQQIDPSLDNIMDDHQQHHNIMTPEGSQMSSAPVQQTADEFTSESLAGVVSFAITKCREQRQTALGVALKKLWKESQDDPHLTHILGAELAHTSTEDETKEFKALMKVRIEKARAEIAEHKSKKAAVAAEASISVSAGTETPDDSPAPELENNMSKEPPARSTRASARRSMAKPPQIIEEPEQRPTSTTRTRRSRLEVPVQEEIAERTPSANGKRSRSRALEPADDDLLQPKRQKRSGSVSSISSLSAVPSDIDQDIEMSDGAKATRSSRKTLVLHGPKQDLRNKGPPKKVLGSFDPPRINGKTVNTADEPEAMVRRQKKQSLLKNYDHIEGTSSAMRKSIKTLGTNDRELFPERKRTSTPRGRQKDIDDTISVASSAHDDLLIPPPPEARRSSRSRQATPNAKNFRNHNSRTSARIKISPQKRGSGLAASFTRSALPQDSPADISDDDEKDNNDFCSTCSGNGRLLCCDGCIRAFHFACLDPPIVEEAMPDDLWFCPACEAMQDPYQKLKRGIWAMLKNDLRKSNTSLYSLPSNIRDYYEGTATNDDGSFLDVPANGKPRPIKAMPGYDEDLKKEKFKLIDKKGQTILCFACGGSALGKREIIGCDYCGLYWHLDCLNPPLANAPFRDPQHRAKYRWMCPAHADSLLNVEKLYKNRRSKNPKIVESQLKHGFRSDGKVIEVELEEDEEILEIEDEAVVYRVSERSIKLDFIDRIRRDKMEQLQHQAIIEKFKQQEQQGIANANQAYRARSAIEKEAVSSLVSMAAKTNTTLQPDAVKEVVDALLDEAPKNVLALLDPNQKRQVSKEEQIRQLLLLQELVGEKLAELSGTS